MSSYFADQNRGSDDNVYVGSTSDTYDIRYQDDSHQTYGIQYTSSDDDDD